MPKKLKIDCLKGTSTLLDMTPEEMTIIAHMPTTLEKIATLEAQQTPRRIREAINGTDNGWLKLLDTQISALRVLLI